MDKSRQLEPGLREDPDIERWALPVNPTDHSGSSELAPQRHHFAVRRKLVAQLTARQELVAWSRSQPPADVDSHGRSPAFRHLLIPSCFLLYSVLPVRCTGKTASRFKRSRACLHL